MDNSFRTAMSDLDLHPEGDRYVSRVKGRYDEYFGASLLSSFVDTVGDVSGCNVLDLGCGRGEMLPYWKAADSVVALDKSSLMLEEAKRHPVGNNVSFLHGTEADISGKFDVVVASRVVGHHPDMLVFLERVRDLIANNGRFVFSAMLNYGTSVNLGMDDRQLALSEQVLVWRSNFGTAASRFLPALPSVAAQAGWVCESVTDFGLTFTSLSDASRQTPLIDYGKHASSTGSLSDEDARLWEQWLVARDQDGSFVAGLTVRTWVLTPDV